MANPPPPPIRPPPPPSGAPVRGTQSAPVGPPRNYQGQAYVYPGPPSAPPNQNDYLPPSLQQQQRPMPVGGGGAYYQQPVVVVGVGGFVCPQCQARIVPIVRHRPSMTTHLMALTLCICMCWPCCLIPYCCGACQEEILSCPNCGTTFQ